MSKIDLVGEKLGDLEVIRSVGVKASKSGYKATYWLCRCSCGKEIEARTSYLKSKKKVSCGCKNQKSGYLNRKTTAKDTSINSLLNRYKQTAKRKGYEWKLSLEKFVSLINSNCNYCDTEPNQPYNVFITSEGKYREGNKQWMDSGWIKYNGIDRENNLFGYLENNVIPCCFVCNRAKSTMELKDFIEWLNKIGKKYGKYS